MFMNYCELKLRYLLKDRSFCLKKILGKSNSYNSSSVIESSFTMIA